MLKPLNQKDFNVKVIKDLGVVKCKKRGHRKAIFECPSCESHITKTVSDARQSTILGYRNECKKCASIKNATTHGIQHKRLRRIWSGMKSRCVNKNMACNKRYLDKSIYVCEEWAKDFKTFYDWAMENNYSERFSLDRIDNNGSYEPNNCRWTTRQIQASNRGKPRNNTSGHKGVTLYEQDRWMSRIVVNGKNNYLGIFKDIICASKAYDKFIEDNNLPHEKNFI